MLKRGQIWGGPFSQNYLTIPICKRLGTYWGAKHQLMTDHSLGSN